MFSDLLEPRAPDTACAGASRREAMLPSDAVKQ
jgi:hypothetical protein